MEYKSIGNKLKTYTLESVTIEILKLLRKTEINKNYQLPLRVLLRLTSVVTSAHKVILS